eukprot:960162_1
MNIAAFFSELNSHGFFWTLPEDLQLNILRFFSLRETRAVGLTNRRWRDLSRQALQANILKYVAPDDSLDNLLCDFRVLSNHCSELRVFIQKKLNYFDDGPNVNEYWNALEVLEFLFGRRFWVFVSEYRGAVFITRIFTM